MSSTDYDVVIIGGAFSGASAATLLRRYSPGCRVLVVERSEAFGRKIGEATVEISAFFLHRVLGLYDHLSREHLPKHGLRYWLSDGPGCPLDQMSEIGPSSPGSLPSFQLDRSKLDEHLLELAADEGAEIARPAKVTDLDLGWPTSRVTFEEGGATREVTTRWVIDASGRHALIARRLRILHRTEEHPTAAVWARFTGVADLDGPDVVGRDPRDSKIPSLLAARRLATNHFCGYGWWCWLIPLSGGETSVGIVYNKKLFDWGFEGSLRERFEHFLHRESGLRELLADATIDADDFHSYSHLPYRAERYMDHGWALVSDAAGFLDPFYSPGLDHASISVFATVRMLERDLRGELEEPSLGLAIDEHNESFGRSYGRWLEALYLDKYEIMGDAELLAAAYFLDTGLYYQGVVSPVYKDLESLCFPLFGAPLPQATFAYRALRFYNRRLVRLARFRRAAGIYGRRNRGWRIYQPFSLGSGALRLIFTGFRLWMGAELGRVLFGLRLRRRPKTRAP